MFVFRDYHQSVKVENTTANDMESWTLNSSHITARSQPYRWGSAVQATATHTQTHTPPVNANLMSVMGDFPFHFSLFFHLLHIIKHYSHSFVPLLSHTSPQYPSYILVVFSLCCAAAEENRNNKGGRWLRESRGWRELRSPWSTASCLNCSWRSKANTQETLWWSHTHNL